MPLTAEATGSPELSIVIPVYRSEGILARLCQEVERAMVAAGVAGRFEMILVCDASPDDSWRVIVRLAREFPFVRGIHLRRNAGQHNAIMAGLARVRGRRVVVMDDDLQHPPAAIPSLLAALDRGFDVCYTHYRNRQHPLWKLAGSKLTDIAARLLLGKPRGIYLSSFKAMERGVADEIVKYDGPYAYVDGLLLDVTRRICSVDIEHAPRLEGEGNYNLRRSISLWLNLATSFSVVPLRLMSVTGFILALTSLALMAYVVVEKLLHPEVAAGWSSLMGAILFVGGIQLMGLGLIGEYLGRAYLNLNRKPQYVVRETTDDSGAASGTGHGE
jgi:undecaprenyl-phosphate 4-deoxy-4-formamido-L-arabinose transferase